MLSLTLRFALAAFPPITSSPHGGPCSAPLHGRALPVDVIGGRMLAHWHLHNGQDLRFYLDTGGNTSLFPETLARLGAPVDSSRRGKNTFLMARVSTSLGDSLVLPTPMSPAVSDTAHTVPMLVSPDPAPDYGMGLPVDGLFGGQWFADRVWVLDYPGRRLLYNGAAPTGPAAPECWVPLGFQIYAPTGHRTTQFPRIAARIDGQEIQFLLDTGARTTLTDGAWSTIGRDEPRQRAASFISQDRFDEWHQHHSDWLVVPKAEEGDSASMIRVPIVEVGGLAIGPVWFTVRPNHAFHSFMSQYMDQPIDGALGGSAWQYVTLILDYPRARAAVLASN